MTLKEPPPEFAGSRKSVRILFAPGAGAPSSHAWMRHWALLLQDLGEVNPMDYPYMLEARKRPDPMSKLVAAHAERLKDLGGSAQGDIVLAGKSMGSRVGCHLSLQQPVRCLICFGYPLCGGGDPSRMRDEVLRQLTTPILFIQGTRDKLCPLELLATVRGQMTAPNALHIVDEGDHSLLVTKRWLRDHQQTQEEVDCAILQAIRKFLSGESLG